MDSGSQDQPREGGRRPKPTADSAADLVTSPVELGTARSSSGRPTTTVAIPTFNAASCLLETLDSVAAQTVPPDEVIVVDDASRDETLAIAHDHPVVTRVIRRANGGTCAARNDAIEAASGDLVMTLDQDDLWDPRYVERMSGLMAANPEAPSGFARWSGFLHPVDEPKPFPTSLDPTSRIHDFASYHHAMMDGLPVMPSFHVARREALRRIGRRPNLEHQRVGEAAYLHGLLAAMGPVVEHVAPLGRYRLHADAVTGDEIYAARMTAPCVDDLRREIAARSDLEIDPAVRPLVDRHAASWYRRCGRRIGGGGHRHEGRALLLRGARLADWRSAGYLAASFIPGLSSKVWVDSWRPEVVRRREGTEAWKVPED